MISYTFIAGLLLGAGVCGHALRLVTEGNGFRFPQTPREWIAWCAIFIYGAATILCLFGHPIGPLIAVIFPFVGITAVIVTGEGLDFFQLTLGIFQFIALIASLFLLTSIYI